MTVKNSAAAVNMSTQRITALKKYVTPKSEITIQGVKYKVADLIAAFQSALDARAEAMTKHTEYKIAIADREAAEASCEELDRGVKLWVAYQFGAASQAAHDFGYPPPRIAKKTVVTKMRALEQSRATREARHTMGKKEKQKIKGAVVAPAASAEPVSLANGAIAVQAASLNGVAH